MADPPTKEKIPVSGSFEDEFLSSECGVPVTVTFSGFVMVKTFDNPTGVQEIISFHISNIASAGDNRVMIKDVGIDKVQVKPDGTAILSIVGQVPFAFTGVLKIDLETGEVIHEAHHMVDTTKACRLLTK